jgi:glycosyltransferase involved in cell wall biosynthesis
MAPPKVTVVIPLFNKALHIRRAVESVLNQSFQEFEIVVVDDGSTDDGAEIVRSMTDARIRLFQQPNRGVSSARNKGIKEARHELISFLDADDNYNPDFLAIIVDLAARHEGAGAYGTSFEIIKENLRRGISRPSSLREAAGAKDILIHDFFKDALSGWVIWSSATAVPKKTFDAVGLFPEGVPLGEDWDMWMRIGARFPIAVSSYIGAIYHREASNRTDTGRIRGIEFELVRTGLRLLSSAPLDEEKRRHLREFVSKFQIITARQWILLGQRSRARNLLLQCRTKRFIVSKAWWLAWTLVPTAVTIRAERLYRGWRRRAGLVPDAERRGLMRRGQLAGHLDVA